MPRRRMLRWIVLAAALFLPHSEAWAGTETVPAVGQQSAESGTRKKSEVRSAPAFETVVKGKEYYADPVGPYGQPRWTTKRPFSMTRVFVRPKGDFEVEYWLIGQGEMTKDASPSFESKLELSYGLGRRLQVDVYLIFGQDSYEGPIYLKAEELELRYAFADWGIVPGNPTLFVEWVRQHGAPEKLETKILLGGNITRKWFWGADISYEVEFGGEWEQEWGVSFGASGVVRRNLVRLGVESKFEGEHEQEGSSPELREITFEAGPSLALTPGRFGILFVPLFGVKHEREEGGSGATAAIYEVYLILSASI